MDYAATGQQALAAIAAAQDLDALEQLRVGLLGKAGLDLGPAQDAGRDVAGRAAGRRPANPRLRASVTDALAERKAALEGAALEARLASETARPDAPRARTARGFDPPGQPGDGRACGNLRRHGLRGRRRARDRGRLAQFHRAQHARKPPGAGDARYVLFPRGSGRGRPDAAAHAHQPGADPHDAGARRAAPDHRAGPGLSLGQRRDPHPDVPPDRRAGDRQGHPPRPSQVDARDLPQGVFRARRYRAAAAPELLPLHRAFGRGRCRLRAGERQAACSAAAAMRRGMAGWSCSARAWSTAR